HSSGGRYPSESIASRWDSSDSGTGELGRTAAETRSPYRLSSRMDRSTTILRSTIAPFGLTLSGALPTFPRGPEHAASLAKREPATRRAGHSDRRSAFFTRDLRSAA